MFKCYRGSQMAKPNTIFFHVCLSCILIGAGYLRFWTLGQQSLWLDEAFSWWQSQRSLPELIKLTASDNTPPLHNLILFLLTRACGDSEVILRFPSAAFGVANVAAIYWLGIILHNRLAGLLASLLLALSEFHIWYSQEARAYTLLALSATLFLAVSVRYLQKPTLAYAFCAELTGVALLYSHAYGTLTWFSISAAVFVTILLAPAGILATASNWLLIQALTVGVFLPWALVILMRPFGGWIAFDPAHGRWLPDPTLLWIREPTWHYLLDQLVALVSGLQPLVLLCVGGLAAILPQRFVSMTANESAFERLYRILLLLVWLVRPPVVGLGVSLLLLSLLLLTRMLGQKRKTASDKTALKHKPVLQANYGVGLLLAWLLGAPLVGLIASVTLQPLFISRYLLGSLPAWLLLASIGATRLGRCTGVGVVAFSMTSLAAFGLLTGPGKRQDWRAVAAFFAQQKQVGDCVLIYQRYMVIPFKYYYRGQIPCLDLPREPNSVDHSTSLATRIWIILAHAAPSDVKALVDPMFAVPKSNHQEVLFGGDVKVFIVSHK